jgi:hypothetical protein
MLKDGIFCTSLYEVIALGSHPNKTAAARSEFIVSKLNLSAIHDELINANCFHVDFFLLLMVLKHFASRLNRLRCLAKNT